METPGPPRTRSYNEEKTLGGKYANQEAFERRKDGRNERERETGEYRGIQKAHGERAHGAQHPWQRKNRKRTARRRRLMRG